MALAPLADVVELGALEEAAAAAAAADEGETETVRPRSCNNGGTKMKINTNCNCGKRLAILIAWLISCSLVYFALELDRR